MRIFVLGGSGFIGRHVVTALLARGHQVIVGSRDPGQISAKLPAAARGCAKRAVRFEQLTTPGLWDHLLEDVDAVINCVGILRERGRETYERIHCLAPAALAADCARLNIRRLIHVSALGLHPAAQSRFLISKFDGEHAIKASGLDWTIVRPSLLDGEGGYGARWIRMMARWPVHFVPIDARGNIAALDVDDLGAAIAVLCEMPYSSELREVELGGTELRTMGGQLAALRRMYGYGPALCVQLPAWLARLASHACDLLHFSPFSFGHLELLRRDNAPRINLLPRLLNRAPKAIGVNAGALPPVRRRPRAGFEPKLQERFP